MLSFHPDEKLTPANRAGLLFAVNFALRQRCHGLKWKRDDEMTSRLAAEAIVEQLELAGYVIMQKPPVG